MTDLRYAIRMLVHSPAFSVVAIVTLALGIGANTAIFSVVNGVLLRPLPFGDPDRIVRVWTATTDEKRSNHSASDFLDLKQENQSLAAIAGHRANLFTAIARPGEPAQLEGSLVTIDFFDVLGVRAALGRTFSRATDTLGDRVVVLSDQAWQRLFARSPQAIGQALRVDAQSYAVIGVLPPKADWPEGSQLWLLSAKEVPPSPLDVHDPTADRDVRYFEAIGRLRPGVTIQQAQDDLHRVALAIQQRHPQTAAGRDVRIAPLREEIVGDIRWALLVLQFAVGLVLLIACANVSSLLLARATSRRRELAIRAAIGAGRGRLIRQLLTESLVLGAVGGLFGLLVGGWLMVYLVRILPDSVPRTGEISFDRVVAISTLLTAMLTGALFGSPPRAPGVTGRRQYRAQTGRRSRELEARPRPIGARDPRDRLDRRAPRRSGAAPQQLPPTRARRFRNASRTRDARRAQPSADDVSDRRLAVDAVSEAGGGDCPSWRGERRRRRIPGSTARQQRQWHLLHRRTLVDVRYRSTVRSHRVGVGRLLFCGRDSADIRAAVLGQRRRQPAGRGNRERNAGTEVLAGRERRSGSI